MKSKVDPAIQRQNAAWLTPGRIVLLYFAEAKKPKYFIVGAVRPDMLLLIVNSVPNASLSKDPKWKACQVGLTQKDYPCFSHIESYADCYQVIETISYDEALSQLAANPKWKKGMPIINGETAKKVIAAVKSSDDIDQITADEIAANLSKLLPP